MTTPTDDLPVSILPYASAKPEHLAGYCAVITEPGPDAEILKTGLAAVAASVELTPPASIRESLWQGATPRVIIARGIDAVASLLPWMPLLQASPSTASIALLDSGRNEVIGTLQHFDVWLPGRTPVPVVVQQTVALWSLLERQARLTGPRRIRGHNLVIDLGREEASDGDGARIPLTPSEFRLLAALAVQPGRVVDFGQLGAALPGHFRDAEDAYNSVKVHVGRLRQKLFKATGWDGHLMSVRGRGFLFERRAPQHLTIVEPDLESD
ncbi:MAG: winged helix-turn-helix domain-containing protein [Dehalococcoidia bacterium]